MDRFSAPPLIDRFGRRVRKLRLSVTDRCNLRCLYCLPEEPTWLPRSEILTFEELERVARVMAARGVDKIRLTGGEPLLRRDLDQLVARLVLIPGVRRVSMTTNGFYLRANARALRDAGLESVTVSLDALEPEVFEQLVKRPGLERVLDGIAAAAEVGLAPIKINCVAMRGVNEEQLLDFAELARSHPYIVRFIEYMPLDSGNAWEMAKVLPGAEVRARIDASWPLERVEGESSDPAQNYRFRDGRGEIGFISSVSEPFCGNCDRIRVTADGKLLNCLFSTVDHDLRAPLRAGSADAEIAAVIARAVGAKEAGHLINQPGFTKPARAMVAIGG